MHFGMHELISFELIDAHTHVHKQSVRWRTLMTLPPAARMLVQR